MALDLPLILLVLLSAAFHASWNALVKTGRDRLLMQALVIGVGAVLAGIVLPFVPVPDRASWPFILLSIVAHNGYYLFLITAYKHGDLSQVYPLARGMAPLLVAGLAALFADEWLTPMQVVGVALVSVGIASLAWGSRRRESNRKAVFYAVITGLFISTYSLIDGSGVRRAGSAAGFIAWLFFLDGIPIVLLVLLRRGRATAELLARDWKRGVVGGVFATVGYAIVVFVMSQGGMAHVVSLRETSVIVAAVIGMLLLKEDSGVRRIVATAMVAAGNILLHLFA